VGVDEADVRECVVELLAQLGHVDVDRAVGLAVGLFPDVLVELLATDDPALARNQRRQQVQLTGGQAQWAPAGQRDELAGRISIAPARKVCCCIAASMGRDARSRARRSRYACVFEL
jgi:hypothetical protein